jgi:hypothetical protein
MTIGKVVFSVAITRFSNKLKDFFSLCGWVLMAEKSTFSAALNSFLKHNEIF